MKDMLVTEAAVALGVSRERAIRMVQAGTLDGHLVAGRWVVSPESVFALRRTLRRGVDRASEKSKVSHETLLTGQRAVE